MKKFVVLYMASGPEFEKMMKNSTPEQRKKGMDAWMKWMNANKASIVEGGYSVVQALAFELRRLIPRFAKSATLFLVTFMSIAARR
jgi:hypothetical protein